MAAVDTRTDEDKIIDSIVIEGNERLFDDTDFLPIRQSLYINPGDIPEYDGDVFHRIIWTRPTSFMQKPEYFSFDDDKNRIGCIQGTLPDETFIGTLMATAAYLGRDLLENVIASKVDDFTKYGIYTCRFYVEGEWVEVVTDTNLPCARDEVTGDQNLAYTRSVNPNETWIAFIQKAYAKAVGSYEAIQKVRVHEALLHLTGGSVQQNTLKDKSNKDLDRTDEIYENLKNLINSETIILVEPYEKFLGVSKVAAVTSTDSFNVESDNDLVPIPSTPQLGSNSVLAEDEQEIESSDIFIQGHLYSVVAYKHIQNFQLLLMHDPWAEEPKWKGEWSNTSSEWDDHNDILDLIESDINIPWKRNSPNGYFWISIKSLLKYFDGIYTCKLFPSGKFSFYCVKDEWKEKTAGGSNFLIRDKADVIRDAAASRVSAHQKAVPAVVIDGELAWFNNPQYRVLCSKPTTLYISLLPTSGSEDHHTHVMHVTVTSMPVTSQLANQKHLWESCLVDIIASSKNSTGLKIKGLEASIWSLEIEPTKIYHIVPHCTRPGLEGAFIVRVFSSEQLLIEKISLLESKVTHGSWTKVGDNDTTGGPIVLKRENGVIKPNPKWCQNPQYHFEPMNYFSKEELCIKIVLHRFDRDFGAKNSSSNKIQQKVQAKPSSDQKDAFVGLVICKADCLANAKIESQKKKFQPKENYLGEIMLAKASTLKKTANPAVGTPSALNILDDVRTILRKASVDEDVFYVETTCSSRTDTTVFFPRLPRAWMPHGLIIIPFLTEKNVKANFEMEIFCSEQFKLTHIPDSYSRCIAGDWRENTAGGSHLLSSWKKNPKYNLKIRNSSYGANSSVRIAVSRYGSKWKNICKKDTVGSMIGFYVFKNKGGEMTQIYESSFVPVNEIVTELNFQLSPLEADEVYTIMPATFAEGKIGSFILSVMCERDFTLRLEK